MSNTDQILDFSHLRLDDGPYIEPRLALDIWTEKNRESKEDKEGRHSRGKTSIGESLLVRSLVADILNQGFCLDPNAPIKLVLDIPQGTAFCSLKTLKSAEILDGQDKPDSLDKPDSSKGEQLRIIAVTFSLCPEYCEDLWDMQPDVLLVDPKSTCDFTSAISRAIAGQSYKSIPGRATPLNQNERQILSLLARSSPNRDIAERLGTREKTVTNTLTRIYDKLNLKGREEAILYYWGAHIKA